MRGLNLSLLLALSTSAAASDGQEVLLQFGFEHAVWIAEAHHIEGIPDEFNDGHAVLLSVAEPLSQGDHDIQVLRLNADGHPIWKTTFGGSLYERPHRIVGLPNGGFAITGTTSDGPTDRATFCAVLEAGGALVWVRTYPGIAGYEDLDVVSAIDAYSSDHLVFTSHLLGSSFGTFQPIIIQVDSLGNTISMTRYEPANDSGIHGAVLNDLVITEQGLRASGWVEVSTMLGVVLEDTLLGFFPYHGISPTFLRYDIASGIDRARALEVASNGDLLLLGYDQSISGPDGSYLMRTNADGVPLSLQRYPHFNGTEVRELPNSLGPASGSPLAISGNLPATATEAPDAALLLTGPDGDQPNAHRYGLHGTESAACVAPISATDNTPHAGLLLAGASDSLTFAAGDDGYLLRTNSDGDTGCHEELYDQESLHGEVLSHGLNLVGLPIEGSDLLDWSWTIQESTLHQLCEDGGDDVIAECFGAGNDPTTPNPPCPCGNPGGPGAGCANSTGLGASLAHNGHADCTHDTLQLTLSHGVPNQPSLFFQGNNSINKGHGNTFGDGLRCCGGGVKRLEVVFLDSNGAGTTTTTISIAGAITCGSTYCYQGWYRDPQPAGGSPCNTYFNLSNALRITW